MNAFLGLQRAVDDADQTLADIAWYAGMLTIESHNMLPTPEDAALLLANIAALRALLTEVIPPGLQKAMDAAPQFHADEADRWEPRTD